MSRKQKIEYKISSIDSPIIAVNKNTGRPVPRNELKQDSKAAATSKASKLPPLPKLMGYPPTDGLMQDLCQAIDRKAWNRARKLSYELILSNPWRMDYHELYQRFNRIIDVVDQRVRPRAFINRADSMGSCNSTESGMPILRRK